MVDPDPRLPAGSTDQPGPEPASAAAEPEEELVRQERREGLWTAARELLDERQYQALWLRYARDMSVKQVAAAMGITQTSAKVILFRARRRLVKSPAVAQLL